MPDGYVTERRLSEVLDAHRHEETEARREVATELSQSLLRFASSVDHVRLEGDVKELRVVVETHERLVRRVEGGIMVLKVFVGTSVIALVVALVGLWKALS